MERRIRVRRRLPAQVLERGQSNRSDEYVISVNEPIKHRVSLSKRQSPAIPSYTRISVDGSFHSFLL